MGWVGCIGWVCLGLVGCLGGLFIVCLFVRWLVACGFVVDSVKVQLSSVRLIFHRVVSSSRVSKRK